MPDVDDLYRVLVHAARESMVVIDDEGTIAFANDAAARWTARSDDKRARRTLFDILHPDDVAVVRAALERCRTRHDVPVFVECRVRQGDGRWIPADVQVRSIEGREGARLVLLQIRDISENLAMRARLSQAHRLASLGRLTTGVADDLGRVMATIRSQLDHLLLHDSMPFGMRVIRRAAETGAALAQQLRAFADAAPASRRSIDVHDLLKDIRRSISPVLWLDVLLTAGATTVRADQETLRQGLTDLILAFANAMPDESIVSVATRNEPLAQHSGRSAEATGVDYLVIEVSNTAEAMRSSLTGDVFEPRHVAAGLGRDHARAGRPRRGQFRFRRLRRGVRQPERRHRRHDLSRRGVRFPHCSRARFIAPSVSCAALLAASSATRRLIPPKPPFSRSPRERLK